MPITHLEQLYQYFRSSQGVEVDPEQVKAGQLFIAFQRARPAQRFLRWVWTVLETISPALLTLAIKFVARQRLYTYVSDDRLVGNSRARQALERGATFAIVDNVFYQRGPRYLLVNDARDTLVSLAERHRRELTIPVVAITGSNGKTTTKELVRQVLASQFEVAATPGTANGVPGVARVVLSIQSAQTMAVTEMGITAPGQISEMCRIAQPTLGLITNIGPAHLRQLKNLDGVQVAKGELFDYLRSHDGHILVNVDDPRVVAAAGNYAQVTTYGTSSLAQIRGEVVDAGPYVRVRCYLPSSSQPVEIQTQLAGIYNLSNILAALTVGHHFGVPLEMMVGAIESFQPVENRSQVIVSGTNRIILDAYNANPGSMAAVLDNFDKLVAENKVLILGDMWDLGSETGPAHRAVLDRARALNPTQAIFVGPEFGRVRQRDFGLYFRNVDEARHWYKASHFENATILIKGAGRQRLKSLLQ